VEPVIQRSFDDLGTPLVDVTFCVVDLETTGTSARTAQITEIGAVKVRGGVEQGRFQTLVDPQTAIPPFITVLTGITQAMVVRAPKIDEALPAFLEFCGDAVIVGHNVRFDLSFLDAAARRLGYPRLPNRWVDTAALARRLVRREVRNLKLGTLAAHFRSPVSPAHRALDDALATMHVLHALLERAGSIGVTALEDLLQLPRARGSASYEKIRLARTLPRRPGVYLFRDRAGDVIYVGKAKNLRTRVQAYFYGDGRRSIQNLLRELHSVEHRVCAGELEAAVTELRLIGAHRPRHNRRSRPPKANHFVTLTAERFPRLSVTRTLHRGAPFVLGPFRSRRAADLVVAALWDATPVRRCTGRPGSRDGLCAPAQLGVALCPCDGSLDDSEYLRAIDPIIAALDDPAPLLGLLEQKMVAHASRRRFEEAAWIRDRHRALARALERRRAWQAMTAAGRLELESIDGERVVVEAGRLLAAWRADEPTPLIPAVEPIDPTPVPPTVVVAEEADLIWRWICAGRVRLLDAASPLAVPRRRIPQLPMAS